jgi:NADP-dependent 3-hydroxy acid dehydrogenase YdfG
MTQHPALTPGNVAVITGGADGIGLAAAHYYKSIGMEVCLADLDADKLEQARSELGEITTVLADVSQIADFGNLKNQAYERYGRVDVLMNNAGVARHCDSWSEYDAWKSVIDINLWGVINGIHSLLLCLSGAF